MKGIWKIVNSAQYLKEKSQYLCIVFSKCGTLLSITPSALVLTWQWENFKVHFLAFLMSFYQFQSESIKRLFINPYSIDLWYFRDFISQWFNAIQYKIIPTCTCGFNQIIIAMTSGDQQHLDDHVLFSSFSELLCRIEFA